MRDTLTFIDRSLEQGDIKQAEVTIARRLRRNRLDESGRCDLLLRRARVRLLSEKPDDALADLRECTALRPELAQHPEVIETLADVLFARFELAPVGFADRADANQARAHYETLLASRPDYANRGWILYQQGRILLSENRVDEAVVTFHEALRQPSRFHSLPALCYERLGFVALFERRDPEAALRCFAQAVEAYPAKENSGWLVQLHILQSRALREQTRYAEALHAARQALLAVDASAPDYRLAYAEAHLAVGEALAHFSGCEADAIDHLVRFLRLGRRPLGVDVSWSRVYETVGVLSFRLARYTAALDAFEQALAYNPYHPLFDTLQLQIARCCYRLHDYDGALRTIEAIHAAARAEGDEVYDYRVYSVQGNAYYAQGQYARAVEAYDRAIGLLPGGGAPPAQLTHSREQALARVRQGGALGRAMDKPPEDR